MTRWNRRPPLPPKAVRTVSRLVLPAYLVLLLIGAVIATPQAAREAGSLLVHGLAFALTVPPVFLMTRSTRSRLVLLACLLAFGGLIELVQLLLSWRSASWLDLVYDAGGLTIGTLICLAIERLARRRQ